VADRARIDFPPQPPGAQTNPFTAALMVPGTYWLVTREGPLRTVVNPGAKMYSTMANALTGAPGAAQDTTPKSGSSATDKAKKALSKIHFP